MQNMRTKTLLLAAALGAAGIASSYAQSVYSVNAVGYVNVSCIPQGFTMICNPLATTNNTYDVLFPNVPDGSTVLRWNNTAGGFEFNNYQNGWDFPTGEEGWVLNVGDGVFFQNAGSTPYVVTFVGEVVQGTNITTSLVGGGFTMVGSKVPQNGLIQSDLNYQPHDGDTVLKWDNSAGGYFFYNYSGGWDPDEPTLAPGESVFIQSVGANTWTRSFTIN